MRKIVAALATVLFVASVSGAAVACPFSTTKDDKKETTTTS